MGRRLSLAIVVALVVGGALSPALLGWHTQQLHTELVAQVNAEHPDLDIAVDHYDRGWFDSRIAYTVTITGSWAEWLHDDAAPATAIELSGRDRVRHGPWVGDGIGVARVDTRLRAPETLRALGQDEIAERPIVHARSRIGIHGDTEARFSVPDHTIEVEARSDDERRERLTLSWQDAGGDAGVRGDVTHFSLRLPRLDVGNEAGEHLAVRDAVVSDRSRRGRDGVWLGEARAALGSAELTLAADEPPESLRLSGLSLDNHSDAEDDRVTIDSRLRLDRLEANGIDLDASEIHLQLGHLDRAVLGRLTRALDGAQRELATDPAAEAAADAEVRAALAELLQGSPELHTERLHIATTEGAITGELRAAFAGERTFDIDVPISLIDPLSGRAELRIPRVLVRDALYAAVTEQLPDGDFREDMDDALRNQIDQAINLLAATRLIEREGDEIILHIDKEPGGPPLVNDQDVMALVQALGELLQ